MKTLQIRENRIIAQMYKKFKNSDGVMPMHTPFEFYTKVMLNRKHMEDKVKLSNHTNG